MKKIFLSIQLCLLGLVFTACSDNDDTPTPVPLPTVEMSVKNVEATAISVKIQVSNAEVCKWICQTAETSLPATEQILESGNVLNLHSDSVATAEELTPNTEYVFLAAAKGEGGSTLSMPLKVKTPEYIDTNMLEANILVEATYRNDNQAGAGQYGLIISNAEPAASGAPQNVGDFQIFIDLFNAPDSDPMNAVLPAGEYNPGTDFAPFTWDPAKSSFWLSENTDGLSSVPFTDGKVYVNQISGGYDIVIDGTLSSGKTLKVHYNGNIQFIQTDVYDEHFTKDQNVTFENAHGFYYGNWFRYFADDMTLAFHTGSIDKNGKQTDGYYLNIPAYMDKLADPYSKNIRLQEGTYTILDRQLTSINSVPMILQKGEHVELFGDFYDIGTYMIHINGSNGRMQIGLCVEGTMNVKHAGNGYKIDFNFKTLEGITITGVYEGDLYLENKCDNKDHEPARPWSTLGGDRVLNIPGDAVAEAYLMGDYLQPGINVWMLVVSPTPESTPGDMFTTELLTTGEEFEFGTYEIRKEFKPFCAIPGFIEYGGQPLYSWVGDLADLDEEGYARTLGPIAEGKFVYSQDGDAHKFVFDMTDDAGNKVTGEWKGKVSVFDARQDMETQAKVMQRVMKSKYHK